MNRTTSRIEYLYAKAAVGGGSQVRILWEEQLGLCWYCKKPVPSRKATKDHVIPRAKGGSSLWENTVMACWPCNQKKGCKNPKRTKKSKDELLVELRAYAETIGWRIDVARRLDST